MGNRRLTFFFDKRRKKIRRQIEVRSAEGLLTLNLPSFLHLTCSFQQPLGNQAEGEGKPHGGPPTPTSCPREFCLWQAAFLFIQVFLTPSPTSFDFNSGQFPNLFFHVKLSMAWHFQLSAYNFH